MTMTASHEAPCYVYVIQVASGPVKIGIAQDVRNRIEELQTANYEELQCAYSFACVSVEQSSSLEALLHRRYRAQHIRGEWFDVRPENIIADIEFASQFGALVNGVEVKRYKYTLSRPERKSDWESKKRASESRDIAQAFFTQYPEYIASSHTLDQLGPIVIDKLGQKAGRTVLGNVRKDKQAQLLAQSNGQVQG